MARITNATVLTMETAPSTTPATRFLLNWTRHQHGMRTARAIATLLQAGREITVVAAPDQVDGFRVDGDFLSGDAVRALAALEAR